jgi:hypothetical protein
MQSNKDAYRGAAATNDSKSRSGGSLKTDGTSASQCGDADIGCLT